MAVDPEVLTRSMTEKELMQAVIDLGRLLHWRHYHTFDSRRSTPGFVDLVLLRVRPPAPGQIVFAELKREGKQPTADQRAWLDDLSAVATTADLLGQPALIQVCVWTPSSWHSGEIERVLKGD